MLAGLVVPIPSLHLGCLELVDLDSLTPVQAPMDCRWSMVPVDSRSQGLESPRASDFQGPADLDWMLLQSTLARWGSQALVSLEHLELAQQH